jgi:hypothetical protein
MMMSFSCALLAAVLAVAAAGCDRSGCGAPDKVTYHCQPVPDGTGGCAGGALGEPTGAGKTFPLGCRMEFPECLLAWDSPKTCICQTTQYNDTPEWECPL